MRLFLGLFLLLTNICDAQEYEEENSGNCPNETETACQCREPRSPYALPCERARPYDAELETPTTWPGKREDAFYDWLTH